MALWKRLVIISASAGAGFALTLALIVGGLRWYDTRPKPLKPWNTTAIKAAFDSVTTEGEENNLVFSYVLENTGDSDYRLEGDSLVSVRAKAKEQNSLTPPSKTYLKLDFPVFIPARQRTLFLIHLPTRRYYGGDGASDDSETGREKYRKVIAAFVSEKMSNLDGFVLFDEGHRYQINFPRGW